MTVTFNPFAIILLLVCYTIGCITAFNGYYIAAGLWSFNLCYFYCSEPELFDIQVNRG